MPNEQEKLGHVAYLFTIKEQVDGLEFYMSPNMSLKIIDGLVMSLYEEAW